MLKYLCRDQTNIIKNYPKEIDFANFINDFINGHPKEIISVMNDLKNSMILINNFFYHCMEHNK